MGASFKVVYSKLDAYLVISGNQEVRLSISSIQISGGLNTIPQAVVTVPIGSHAAGLKEADGRQSLFSDTAPKVFAQAYIILSVDSEEPVAPDIADQKNIIIFEGRVASLSINVGFGEATAQIQLIHWLIDIATGSMLTNQLLGGVGLPGDLLSTTLLGGADTSTTDEIFESPHFASIVGGAAQTDVWAAIKKMLNAIGNHELIHTQLADMEVERALGSDLADSNKSVLEILKRINTDERFPLRLKSDNANDSTVIATAIERFLGQTTASSASTATYWSKIIADFAPSLMFALVPRTRDAVIVPFQPGTRELYKVISRNSYSVLQTDNALSRPISAVYLQANIPTDANAQDKRNRPVTKFGGAYVAPANKDASVQGVVLFRHAPSWLSHLLARGEYVQQVVSKVMYSLSDNTTPHPDLAAPFLTQYAKGIYVHEMLSRRTASLSGKLRFDIAPGSTIGVEVSRSGIDADPSAENIIGVVASYSHMIDCEGPTATTNFRLTHVRTLRENEDAGLTLESHPLYEGAWDGTYLVGPATYDEST